MFLIVEIDSEKYVFFFQIFNKIVFTDLLSDWKILFQRANLSGIWFTNPGNGNN